MIVYVNLIQRLIEKDCTFRFTGIEMTLNVAMYIAMLFEQENMNLSIIVKFTNDVYISSVTEPGGHQFAFGKCGKNKRERNVERQCCKK